MSNEVNKIVLSMEKISNKKKKEKTITLLENIADELLKTTDALPSLILYYLGETTLHFDDTKKEKKFIKDIGEGTKDWSVSGLSTENTMDYFHHGENFAEGYPPTLHHWEYETKD